MPFGGVMDVVIYSSFRLFGECLERCLTLVDDVSVLAVVHDEVDLRLVLERLSVDLLLVDVTACLDHHQFELLCADFPGLLVLAVGLLELESDVVRCGRIGFAGYVPRDASVETLKTSMRECISGRLSCSDAIAGSLLRALRVVEVAAVTPLISGAATSAESVRCLLSAREVTVTRLVRRGFSNKEIARELNISVATVKNHVHHLLEKLELPGRVQVVRSKPEPSWGLDQNEQPNQGLTDLKRG